MVQLLLETLPRAAPEIEVHHVNLSLSRTGTDIGRWQPTKLLAARRALRAAQAKITQFGCDHLYYIPAPGKRIALWRDVLLLRSLRPNVQKLVLHWHASGLGNWLETRATGWERQFGRQALSQADLSIALADSLLADIEKLTPRQTAVVPNGIPDPFAGIEPPHREAKSDKDPVQILFLGAGSEAKGLFRTVAALEHLPERFSVTFGGDFVDRQAADNFKSAALKFKGRVHHAGFVDAAARRQLLTQSDVLAFPTTYEHEAFPLVLIEALAANLPIVTTRWRAIPDLMPPAFTGYVNPTSPEEIAHEIIHRVSLPALPDHRLYYLNHYTTEAFGQRMAGALRELNDG